jgi:gluconate kinase
VTPRPDARRYRDNDDHREVVRRMHDESSLTDEDRICALEAQMAELAAEVIALRRRRAPQRIIEPVGYHLDYRELDPVTLQTNTRRDSWTLTY